MPFELPKLDYAYDALEPHYDAQTIEIHHSKHHQAYTNNFNKAVEAAGLDGKSVEEILQGLDSAPAAQKTALTNHGGGYYNHDLFWKSLSPNGGGEPKGDLAAAINSKWGSFDKFKEEFTAAAGKHFGSGWAFLVVNPSGDLEIVDTHDQVSPVTAGHKPVFTIDVWEHAYYLKYQNRRPEWIAAFWNMVNWDGAEERYKAAKG